MICSCSGAAFGVFNTGSSDVAQAWAKSVNAAGGINGHQVQLIVKDDQFNPGNALNDEKTIVADGADAVIDLSAVDTAWASAIQQSNIPVIGAYSDTAPFFTNPDFYPEGQTGDSINYAVLAIAKNVGAKNVGVLYCAEAAVCASIPAAMAPIGAKLGVPVTYKAEISATAPNYTAQCLAAKQAGIGTLFIGDASTIEIRVAADCAQQGYEPTYVVQGGGTGTNMFPATGFSNHLNIQYADLPFWETSNPGVKNFDTVLNQDDPSLLSNNQVFVQNTYQTWVSLLLFAKGIEAGGLTASSQPTAAMVTTGLESLKGETLGGLTPPLTFPAGKPHPIDCWFAAEIRGGKAIVTNGGKYTCSSSTAS